MSDVRDGGLCSRELLSVFSLTRPAFFALSEHHGFGIRVCSPSSRSADSVVYREITRDLRHSHVGCSLGRGRLAPSQFRREPRAPPLAEATSRAGDAVDTAAHAAVQRSGRRGRPVCHSTTGCTATRFGVHAGSSNSGGRVRHGQMDSSRMRTEMATTRVASTWCRSRGTGPHCRPMTVVGTPRASVLRRVGRAGRRGVLIDELRRRTGLGRDGP